MRQVRSERFAGIVARRRRFGPFRRRFRLAPRFAFRGQAFKRRRAPWRDGILGLARKLSVLSFAALLPVPFQGCAPRPSESQAPAKVEIAVDGPAAAERLSEAVRFRTISREGAPPAAAAFERLHALLEARFPRAHQVLGRERVNDYSLLYTWPGRDPAEKPILLMAHLDVVPVEEGTESQWTRPPFDGVIDGDGVIWGRGTLDDKLGVLGLLEAVEFLVAEGFAPRRTVYFAFGHDEEIDGLHGARAIAEELKRRGVQLEFALDEGSIIAIDMVDGVEKPVAMIGLAEKGYARVRVTAEGVAGHAAMPPRDTAIGRLSTAIRELKANPMPAEIREPFSGMLDTLAPEMSFFQRLAMSNRWIFGPLVIGQLEKSPGSNAMIRTTSALTKLDSGDKDNAVPAKASVFSDVRLLPGDTIESAVAHMQRVAGEGVEVTLAGDSAEATPVSDSGSPSFALLRRTVLEVFPDVVVAPTLVIAATDGRHYADVADNVYRFLPVRLNSERLEGIHGKNERIETEAYADVIRFYIQLLRNTAG